MPLPGPGRLANLGGMIRVNCPSCGAAIDFVSRASVSAVCAHCRALVVRRGGDPEAIGTVAQLPPDLSPVMIGSAGKAEAQRFTVVGRRRMGWADGGWNEWQLRLDDSKPGILGEAQGRWTVSRPHAAGDLPEWLVKLLHDSPIWQTIAAAKILAPLPDLPDASLLLGRKIELGRAEFCVTDVKAARCISAEGELFEAPRLRETVLAIDALGPGGAILSIERHKDGIEATVGRHFEWPALAMQRTRPLAGWDERRDAG